VPLPSVGQAIPVGETPGYAVATPDGRQLYVANREARTLTVVDVELEQTIGQIPVPVGPVQFVAFAPDGQTAYLSLYDKGSEAGAFGVLDIRTREVVTTVPLDGEPWSPAVTRDGSRVYLPLVGPDTVTVIDTTTDTVLREVPVDAGPHSVAVNPVRPLVANVNYDADTVTVIDTNTDQVITSIPVGAGPQDVTWAPDGHFAYVTCVDADALAVIAADDWSVTATFPIGDAPTSVAVLPDGSRGYVTNLNDGTVRVLDLDG
jgi:YVTN family beta-propeller protein